jgi:hypothetical protein
MEELDHAGRFLPAGVTNVQMLLDPESFVRVHRSIEVRCQLLGSKMFTL